ncbi:MAG: hypothetical protein AAGB31_15465 [Bdellovibrio sp.]
MAGETKKKAGRKHGFPITEQQFDDLIAALGGTYGEIANLCGKSLRPQAVSWWRHSKGIPIAHLNRLASELVRQLKEREPTDVDKRALAYLKQAKAIQDLTGSVIMDSRSALFHTMQQQQGLALPSLTDLSEKPDQINQLLAMVDEKSLVKALEARGWDVSLTLKKK